MPRTLLGGHWRRKSFLTQALINLRDWLKLGFRQLLRYIGSLLLIITYYFFGTDGCNQQVLSRQALGTSEMFMSVLARVRETSWRPFAYSLGLLLKWEITGRLSFLSSAVAFLVLFSWFDLESPARYKLRDVASTFTRRRLLGISRWNILWILPTSLAFRWCYVNKR